MIAENGVTTEFVSFNGLVLGGYNKSREQTEHYYYGTSLIAAELKAGNTSSVDTAETSLYYYIKNSHGDVIGLTDNNGTLTETYRYDAFGTLTDIQSLNEHGVLAEAETAMSRFLYAGEQYDAVTGLYYLRARQYDTIIGRFTQEDTYLGDGRNLYAYVRNNPLKYVDPSGYCSKNLGYNGCLMQQDLLFNPGAQLGVQIAEQLPEDAKSDFAQGLIDNCSPVDIEITEDITFYSAYLIGYALAEILPGEDIASAAKDVKRANTAVKAGKEILENANEIDNAIDILKKAEMGPLDDLLRKFTKHDEVAEDVIKSGSKTIITPEMEEKILLGQRKNPAKNELIGGHSPNINNANPNYAVEVLQTNPDGTQKIKFVTQYADGNLSNIKTSTIFPDSWSDDKIIESIKAVGDSSPIGVRTSDGAMLYREIIDGVQIEVIKIGDTVTSGYPTGSVKTGLLPGFNSLE